jgi:hypothetical protein
MGKTLPVTSTIPPPIHPEAAALPGQPTLGNDSNHYPLVTITVLNPLGGIWWGGSGLLRFRNSRRDAGATVAARAVPYELVLRRSSYALVLRRAMI